MMNLILDFGNTCKKLAVVSERKTVFFITQSHIGIDDIVAIEKKYKIRNAILSSVINDTQTIENYLTEKYTFVKLSEKTPLPVKNVYRTKDTLGSDRLACAVAAQNLFPEENVLVLQLGTCITSDFITEEGVYMGGSISPGMEMRFKALHHFSDKLPLIEYQSIDYITGQSSEEAILSGVIHGIIAECNYLIANYKSKYPYLKVIVTGGNLKAFENAIKGEITPFPELVISGLDLILYYNVER
ncbi:MAG: type III pantothenate kinase [Bacteroidales bacterium]|jgi:type III pantothenate kinase|nr:type III pantothenate kinase [Bacteroidales bacterium]